jgi:hypothetical protein
LLAPADPADDAWRKLAEITGRVEGTIRDHPEIRWREGVAVRLDWADERLWLLADPRIIFDGVTPETKAKAADFARERTVKRYNRDVDKLIHFWTRRLAGQGCGRSTLATAWMRHSRSTATPPSPDRSSHDQ